MPVSNFTGTIFYIIYYIFCAGSISLLDYHTSFKREYIRKVYHLMYCFSIFIILYLFKDWYFALLIIIIISFLGIIVLKSSEKVPFLMKLSISRGSDLREVIKQMLYIHGVFIMILLIFKYLWHQENYHAILGIIIWGFGDSAAAITGKIFGKKYYNIFPFSSLKTIEGSIGFIISAFIPAFLILYTMTDYKTVWLLITTIILIIAASLTEAISRRGLDTITIPFFVIITSIIIEKLIS